MGLAKPQFLFSSNYRPRFPFRALGVEMPPKSSTPIWDGYSTYPAVSSYVFGRAYTTVYDSIDAPPLHRWFRYVA